jgi:ferritin
MKISQKMQDAINKQINNELYSSYLYLSMSGYFESINLKGFAHWMRMQAKEELEHAMKLFDYNVERSGKVQLLSIEKPPTDWASPVDAIENVLHHEQEVTELINGLVNVAKSENDNATNIFLNWFVTEQVEEESTAEEILNKVKLLGSTNSGLFMVDKELAQRKD